VHNWSNACGLSVSVCVHVHISICYKPEDLLNDIEQIISYEESLQLLSAKIIMIYIYIHIKNSCTKFKKILQIS